MSNLKTSIFLFLLAFLFLPIYTQAGGISVYPDKLFFQIQDNLEETLLASVQISNPGPETAVFEAYLEEYPNTLKINPRIFVLGPGGQTTIEITPINLKLKKADNPKRLTLNIVSTNLKNSPILVSAGYKMAVTLNYKNAFGLNVDKFLTGLFALSLLAIAGLFTKK